VLQIKVATASGRFLLKPTAVTDEVHLIGGRRCWCNLACLIIDGMLFSYSSLLSLLV
jgi:hypothetical protein